MIAFEELFARRRLDDRARHGWMIRERSRVVLEQIIHVARSEGVHRLVRLAILFLLNLAPTRADVAFFTLGASRVGRDKGVVLEEHGAAERAGKNFNRV